MFNWSQNITLPKISDVLDPSDTPMNFMRMFTYVWVWFLGAWFFAAVIAIIGAAIYVKYENGMVAAAWFIVSISLLGGTSGVLFADSALPSANVFVYIIGLVVAFLFGITLYMLFVSKRE